MLSLIVKLTRIGVVVFWSAMILSMASVIPDPYSAPIIWTGVFVLLIHLSAYFFVRRMFDQHGGADISFTKTLVFGFTHWLPLISTDTAKTEETRSPG